MPEIQRLFLGCPSVSIVSDIVDNFVLFFPLSANSKYTFVFQFSIPVYCEDLSSLLAMTPILIHNQLLAGVEAGSKAAEG